MKFKMVIFFSMFIVSCKSPKDNLFTIDPRTFGGNAFALSQIATDITYCPLDNNIPFVSFKHLITPEYYYFSAKGIGILQFSREGRLIKKIGSRGRGPGEYYYGMDFAVDDKSGRVYVMDPKRIFVYSRSGIFIRNISYEDYISAHSMARGIELFNSMLFIPDYLMEGNSKYNWIILDTLGNLVSKKNNTVPPFQTKVGRPGYYYLFENELFYFNYYNDTIFSINSDFEHRGSYLFAQGNHRWPRSITTYDGNFANRVKDLFLPITMFETKRYIFIQYYYLQRAIFALIDKKSEKRYISIKDSPLPVNDEYHNFALKNDIDGGMPLTSMEYYTENGKEYITTLISPFDLKVYVSADEFKRYKPKYPEKKQELEKLASSLKETDNPILVLVSLK